MCSANASHEEARRRGPRTKPTVSPFPDHTARPWIGAQLARVACAVLLASALAGCDEGGSSLAARPPTLATAWRLAEHGLVEPDDPRVERNQYVVIEDTAHPTLTRGTRFAPRVRCGPAPAGELYTARRCNILVPLGLPAAPASVLSWIPRRRPHREGAAHDRNAAGKDAAPGPTAAVTSGTQERAAAAAAAAREEASRSVVFADDLPGTEITVLTSIEATAAQIYQIPSLEERELVTQEIVVPPRAVLRLSFGVETSAWWIDSAPVYFRVVVETEDGQRQDLLRRILDPARKPAERGWFDADVDLTDLVGRKVRLRFTTEPAEAGDTRPSLPVWGDPRILTDEPERELGRPSIVLISLDTLRAKSVSAYGYELDTTPTMEAFAAQGALFENAFTTFSNTLGSHMSMLTGLYPATHGVLLSRTVLGPEHPTLAELLRDAGYATAAFTEDALLDGERGFRRGFSSYYENTAIGAGAGDAADTFGRALEWVGRHADERFFVFIHTYEVHEPYDPPAEYRHLFVDHPHRSDKHRAYEQEARRLDDELRRLLDGLRSVVPEEDLLIVVTADHGEEFGEHNGQGHVQLYDEVMHVPLMMVWPGHIPAGLRIPTVVSLVDIVPTLLELAGVPAPPGLEGRSLVPLLSDPPGELDREFILAEQPPWIFHAGRRYIARSATAKCFAEEKPDWQDVCHDLEHDPKEKERLDPQDRTEFVRLHAAAMEYRERALQVVDKLRREIHGKDPPGARPTPAPGEPAAPPPDERVERKLRALGYTE